MKKTAEQMAQEILDVCSGQPSDEAHGAMVAAMACHIGGLWHGSGKTLRQAQEAIIDLAADLDVAVKRDWGDIETQPLQ